MTWRAVHADFQRPRPVPRIGWVCLVLGLALLGASGWRHSLALQAAEARLLQEANATRQAKAAAVPVPLPSFMTDVRWRAAAQELAQPWDERLQALESATAAPVHLLSLQPDRRSGTLRLEAEVGQYTDALAYVDRLAATSLLGRPVLLSHELVQDPGGRPYLRVVISTAWPGRVP